MDGAYNNERLIPFFKGDFYSLESITRHSVDTMNFEAVTSDKCPGFHMITTAEVQLSVFVCSCSQLYDFYAAAEKCAFVDTLQIEHVAIPLFSAFVGRYHLQQAGAKWEESSRLCYHVYFIPSHVSL